MDSAVRWFEMPVSVQISNIRIAVWGLDIFFFLDNNS